MLTEIPNYQTVICNDISVFLQWCLYLLKNTFIEKYPIYFFNDYDHRTPTSFVIAHYLDVTLILTIQEMGKIMFPGC